MTFSLGLLSGSQNQGRQGRVKAFPIPEKKSLTQLFPVVQHSSRLLASLPLIPGGEVGGGGGVGAAECREKVRVWASRVLGSLGSATAVLCALGQALSLSGPLSSHWLDEVVGPFNLEASFLL